MKIAFFVGQFPSLSETFILNQITGLIQRGHNVEIFAAKRGSNNPTHPEVARFSLLSKTHYSFPIPENRSKRLIVAIRIFASAVIKSPRAALNAINIFKYGRFAASLKMLYLLPTFLDNRHSFDIIHSHFGPNGICAAFLRDVGLISGKVVTTFHAADLLTDIARYGPNLYKSLFATGDLFLPISDRWRNRLLELGAPTDLTVVHRMGVDIQSFQKVQLKTDLKPTVQFVTICRLTEKKGIEYAIRAIAQIPETKPFLRFHVAGDGPLLESLENLTNSLGLEGIVRFVGPKPKDEVATLLSDSDVFVAPSVTAANGDQEGIPVAIMEAMSFGLPVISTLHSGIPELIQNGTSGILVHERDVTELAKAIEWMANNPKEAREMGAKGAEFVQEHYDISRLNDELEDLYHKLLSDAAIFD